jgi:tetratricopeptide (TPR) repeat protein
MTRRRPFRRRPWGRRPLLPRGGPPRRSPVSARVRHALARANSLMADGQFARAADIFERLAERAKRQGVPVRAGDLSLQASRASLGAGDVQASLERAAEALRLFVRGDRAQRVPRVLSKMAAALREGGYDAQAERLERQAEQILGEAGLSLEELRRGVPQVTERRGTLPALCSGCGAPFVPDEVEWHDAHTAECLYCGMVVKAV